MRVVEVENTFSNLPVPHRTLGRKVTVLPDSFLFDLSALECSYYSKSTEDLLELDHEKGCEVEFAIIISSPVFCTV